MESDFRASEMFREIESLCTNLRQPGTGQISDAAELHVSPDCSAAVFSGTIMDVLEGVPPTRICRVDLTSGDIRVLTFGPNTDRSPSFSPDGHRIAFLSDRHKASDTQLYLLYTARCAVMPTPPVLGWVEYLHWSPDGTRVLLGVAGHGADVAGVQGAITSDRVSRDVPSWMPSVDKGDETHRWRSAWVYELATNSVRQVSQANTNVWEAVWCGNGNLLAIVSAGPSEGLWYRGRLCLIEINAGESREIYGPQDQLGWPSASPSGKHAAVVEALCSDRGVVAGELRVIDVASGNLRRIDGRGIDFSYTEWRSDRHLLLAGHRGFESVVGVYDASAETFSEVWSSREITTAGSYISISGVNVSGDFVMVGEGFTRAPEIAVVRSGDYKTVRSFDLGYSAAIEVIQAAEQIAWKAPDGLEIQGWLLRPRRQRPHPLIMAVHGGPVAHTRPRWLARTGLYVLTLLKHGYAVFFPNPRGSAGQGREYVRRVCGDMGGADTQDCLSGLDCLIERGVADPARLGVTGVSYGGYMTSWLVAQDNRFAAAVAVSPVTNWVTEHLLSNIPDFDVMFLADTYSNSVGKYFARSPIMYAHKVKTPTLSICGSLDRCTPPAEAMQFHSALLENAVKSVLVIYPEEGHGIRRLPANIDCAARLVTWFEEHMPAKH